MDNSALTQYLDKHRRAVQLKQLGILKEIDAICSRNHIDYWLDGGTILGAVRHGGFSICSKRVLVQNKRIRQTSATSNSVDCSEWHWRGNSL